MKILFVVHGYKPAWQVGGPILSVSALAENLVKKGHQVTVFTTNMNLNHKLEVPLNTPISIDGVDVYYFPCEEYLKKYLPGIKYFSQSIGTLYCPDMKRALLKFVPEYDLVHVHLPFIYPTMAAANIAFKFNKPLFYHQRGVLDPDRLKYRALKKRIYLAFIEKPILKRATTLIALTNAEFINYRRLGVETPCEIIPNGTVISDLSPLDSTQEKWLKSLGVEPTHKVILFIARLHPMKGAQRLLDAFMAIASEIPDAFLIMAGPDECGIRQGFLNKINKLNLAKRISFPGMVEGNNKHALFKRANLFCLPSDAEGFSMAVLEALSNEVPVLISTGCHFDEVEAVGAGWIVDANAHAIANALRNCLANEINLDKIGINGRKLVQSKYSWEKITERMILAYKEGVLRHAALHMNN